MGKMLGWLKRKVNLEQINSGLITAFSRIKEDIQSQRKFLEDFYEQHHGFRHTTHLNHQRIAEWIKHFDASIKRLEKDVKALEGHVQKEFDAFSTASLNLFKEAYAKNIKDVQAVKKEVLKEVEVFIKEKTSKTAGNAHNVANVKKVMSDSSFDALSNPEKWLVGVLFNASDPLSYSQIAQKTGKSINTVRVYMNQLKFKDFIDESSLPNGTKIFSLRHKAKVKKLYNL